MVKILRLLVVFVFVLGLLAVFPSTNTVAEDYNYRFRVVYENVTVEVMHNGGARITYEITFYSYPGAQAIDIVDIGMPNDDYDLSTARGYVDDKPTGTIKDSEYLDCGVEVHLRPDQYIHGGETKTLRFSIVDRKMVFRASQEGMATVEFRPTWFSPDFCTGTDYLSVTMIFPAGVNDTMAHGHMHRKYDENGTTADGRIYYRWIWHDQPADLSSSIYLVGIYFPSSCVSHVYDPFWDTEASSLFFGYCCATMAIVVVIGGGAFLFYYSNKYRKDYIKPRILFEGTGVRLGFTAPEAAVVLNTPPERILMMILYGLMRKGVIEVALKDPLMFRLKPYNPSMLREYEVDFLKALTPVTTSTGETLYVPDKDDMKDVLVKLIRDVNRKMAGFNLKETREYYRNIVNNAWNMVSRANTPEMKVAQWNQYYGWLMADDDFPQKSRTYFAGVYVGQPATSEGGNVHHGTVIPTVSMPELPGSDFADAIVSNMETMANDMVGPVEEFADSIFNAINPSTSGGGGGGAGCACACACACAGGGR